MNNRFRTWRSITLASYFLLLLHIILWFFVFDPPVNKSFAILSIIYLLVLLLPLRQLFANNSRVYLWSSYLILLYFIHAVVESYANEVARVYALIELVLTITYFIASTFCYRYSRQQAKQQNPADTV